MTAIPQHFHFDPPIKMTPKIDDIPHVKHWKGYIYNNLYKYVNNDFNIQIDRKKLAR
jgi:hypothetical protein